MPWDLIPLNDGVSHHVRLLSTHSSSRPLGNAIPSIAFGTWTLGNGQGPVDKVDQALSVGFSHIGTFTTNCLLEPRDWLTDWLTDGCNATLTDTAQMYRNEEEVGKALRESGLARKDVYITTKYSGSNGLDIQTSIHNSLKMVRPSNPLSFTSNC
jgi:diketogulonate reductase-like aldo/keto reductase